VLELYAVMQAELPKLEDVNKIRNFGALVSKVHELAGGNAKLLYRVLRFNSIVSEFTAFVLGKTLSVPDVGKLHDFWGKTSKYCHRQISPDESWDSISWVQKGYKLLDEVDVYLNHLLVDHHVGSVKEKEMPPEVIKAKREFVQEKIDEQQLRTRLKIMEPVLTSRLMRK
jgi:hypothetical protein